MLSPGGRVLSLLPTALPAARQDVFTGFFHRITEHVLTEEDI